MVTPAQRGRSPSSSGRCDGDPTVEPNPNLRPLKGPLYAVCIVRSDLGQGLVFGHIAAQDMARRRAAVAA